MIVTNFVLVLGLFVVCYGHTVPLSKVQVTDHGLHGYISHRRQVTKKSGSTQGHAVHRRSFGSELESDSSSNDEDLTTSESGYYGGYGHQFGGFHSYLPYPPSNHGPYPGAYPPPFGQQHHQMPGHGSNNGWGNNFGPPCHGFGCGHGKHDDFQHGRGNGHGHGNGYGHGNGNGHGHGNEHGHGNDRYPPFHNDNHNCNEQGPGHEHGHGHGHGYGHGNQGHGNGNNPNFGGNGGCKYDGPDKNEPMHATEPTQSSEMTEPSPIHEMPTTEKVMTVPSVPSTEEIPVTMPPSSTTDPIYDIDVRLGSRK